MKGSSLDLKAPLSPQSFRTLPPGTDGDDGKHGIHGTVGKMILLT